MHRKYDPLNFTRWAKLIEKEVESAAVLEAQADPVQQSSAEHAIHLLRRLLRECTYLPDPAARAYLRPYIVSRFKEYHPIGGRKHASREREKALLEKGEIQCSLLRRANQGERKPLEKVLLVTYGRIGKRRHELLAPLLQPGKPLENVKDVRTILGRDNVASARPPTKQAPDATMTEALRTVELLRGRHHSENKATDDMGATEATDAKVDMVVKPKQQLSKTTIPQITPQLQALARSQRLVRPMELTRTNPKEKDLSLQVPSKDAKGRPLGLNRRLNLAQGWYANLLGHILPPVSEYEWNRLRDLACGKIEWEGLRNRRPAAKELGRPEYWGNYANRHRPPGLREVLRGLLRAVESEHPALAKEVGIAEAAENEGNNRERHHMTQRFMRRLWARVFEQCPLMTWDSEKKQWRVV